MLYWKCLLLLAAGAGVHTVTRMTIFSSENELFVRPWMHAPSAKCQAATGEGQEKDMGADWVIPSTDAPQVYALYDSWFSHCQGTDCGSPRNMTSVIYLQGRQRYNKNVIPLNVTCRFAKLDPASLHTLYAERTLEVFVSAGSLVPWLDSKRLPGNVVNFTCSVGVFRNTFDVHNHFSPRFFFSDFTYFNLSRLDGDRVHHLKHLVAPVPPYDIRTNESRFRQWHGDYCDNFRESNLPGQTCEVHDGVWWVFSISQEVTIDKHQQIACDVRTKDITPVRAVRSF